jgi:hypothetical protein
MQRIETRQEESKGVFSQLALLQEVSKRFHSTWFTELFQSHGTCLRCFNTDLTPEIMSLRIQLILDHLLYS